MHVNPVLIIPSLYSFYVVWVISSGEYTVRKEVSWFGSFIFGDLVESETVTKEDMPFRFWFKVGVDIAIIAAITIFVIYGDMHRG